jgi:hypothetical protein
VRFVFCGGKQDAQRRKMSQLNLEGLTTYELSYHSRVVQALADFRREWQEVVNGKSLIDVKAPIGLILADIADRLELNLEERHVMLGGKLINQVDSVLEERISAKLQD